MGRRWSRTRSSWRKWITWSRVSSASNESVCGSRSRAVSCNLERQPMMRIAISPHFLAALLAASLLTGCGGGAPSGDGGATPKGPQVSKDGVIEVGFIYVGPKDDYGYNQAH